MQLPASSKGRSKIINYLLYFQLLINNLLNNKIVLQILLYKAKSGKILPLCPLDDLIIKIKTLKNPQIKKYIKMNKGKCIIKILTLSVQIRTTLDNSITTRSTHFRHGSFKRDICFLTIASKAISGVNNPTRIPVIKCHKKFQSIFSFKNKTTINKTIKHNFIILF